MQPLLAEVVELHLPGEVLPDYLLGRLRYRRLVDVAVDLAVDLNLIWKERE